MEKIFAVISGLLALTASPPYILDILRHKTKPQRMTWLIFTTLGVIALISQWSLGATWSLVFLALDAAASLLVLLLSLKHGVGGHTNMDKVALGIAGLGAVISLLEGRPLVALLGVIIADLAGFSLTIRKTYLEPGSETAISWILFGLASLFGALAVGGWKLDLLIYPLYVAAVCFAVPLVQLLGTRNRSDRSPIKS